jgi:ABC-type nickel/cobalt efflux system permease component RcnA
VGLVAEHVVIRKYALGLLIPPALLLAVGWFALQGDGFFEIKFLAFVGTPAAVMVLAWAAVVANEIANRRSERRPHQGRSAKILFVYPLAPAILLLSGWAALRVGYIDEALFLLSAGAPAAVLLLAWAALVANEVANRRAAKRQHHD